MQVVRSPLSMPHLHSSGLTRVYLTSTPFSPLLARFIGLAERWKECPRPPSPECSGCRRTWRVCTVLAVMLRRPKSLHAVFADTWVNWGCEKRGLGEEEASCCFSPSSPRVFLPSNICVWPRKERQGELGERMSVYQIKPIYKFPPNLGSRCEISCLP